MGGGMAKKAWQQGSNRNKTRDKIRMNKNQTMFKGEHNKSKGTTQSQSG